MKSLLTIFALGFALLLGLSACRNKSRSIDAQRLHVIISREIAIGDAEQKLLQFYKDYEWSFEYDKWKNAYTSSFIIDRRNGVLSHMVIVEVRLTDGRKVATVDCRDAVK